MHQTISPSEREDNDALENIASLPLELAKKAHEELNENPETRLEDIRTLRNLVLKEPGLTSQTNNEFLLRFLRARKFKSQEAFNMLRQYYKIAQQNPHLFKNLSPSHLKHVFDANIQGFLPERDSKGRAIFIFRVAAWNPSEISMDDICRSNVVCLEKIIEDEAIQINGVVFLVDMSGLSLSHFYAFTPNIRIMASILQDSFPCRFKSFHIVRESTLTSVLVSIAKPFLKMKLRSRIHLHGNNMEALHHYIPKEILPKEFGGLKEPFNNSSWYEHLLENEEIFQNRTRFGYKGT